MRLTEDLDLRRPRLGVLLRPILAVPVLFVALLWGLAVLLALPAAWLAAVVTGRVPAFLHRVIATGFTYLLQVDAWGSLVSGRYPWPRRRDRHPVQLQAERERQPRWSVLLRPLLALPALVLMSVTGVVHWGTAVAAWFVALARGRTTEGLRELGTFCFRYFAETNAYLLLLTPAYPRLASRPAPTEEP